MQHLYPIIVALLGWSSFGCGGGEAGERCGPSFATVSRVLDGDTIDVVDEDGSILRIRYLHVDTPELTGASDGGAECYAQEARDLNASLTSLGPLRLEYDETCLDRYDRLLAFVYVQGRMLNEVLLERGMARLLIIPPNQKYAEPLSAIAAEAQVARAGLWGVCE